jgi:hypothetical protein
MRRSWSKNKYHDFSEKRAEVLPCTTRTSVCSLKPIRASFVRTRSTGSGGVAVDTLIRHSSPPLLPPSPRRFRRYVSVVFILSPPFWDCRVEVAIPWPQSPSAIIIDRETLCQSPSLCFCPDPLYSRQLSKRPTYLPVSYRERPMGTNRAFCVGTCVSAHSAVCHLGS